MFLASVLFYVILCWVSSITPNDKTWINKFIRIARSINIVTADSLEKVFGGRNKEKSSNQT